MENGVKLEKDRPYTEHDGICSSKERSEAMNVIKDFKGCEENCNADEYMKWLADGPLIVAMDSGSDEAFAQYKPGEKEIPWNPSACNRVDHAVTVLPLVGIARNEIRRTVDMHTPSTWTKD